MPGSTGDRQKGSDSLRQILCKEYDIVIVRCSSPFSNWDRSGRKFEVPEDEQRAKSDETVQAFASRDCKKQMSRCYVFIALKIAECSRELT